MDYTALDNKFHEYVETSDLYNLSILHSLGVDIYEYYAIRFAAKSGNLDIIKYLIKPSETGTSDNPNIDIALQIASKYGHLDIIIYLLNQGANIHAKIIKL